MTPLRISGDLAARDDTSLPVMRYIYVYLR